jgi:tetratricopeptide (TPR) repeat protein
MELAAVLSLHQAGRLAEAEAAYRAMLAAAPEQPQALHGYGVLLDQQGRHEEGAALITRAIAAQPGEALFHFNLGLSHFRAGDFSAAVLALGEAARLNPAWPQAQYDLGNALRAAGRLEEAARAFRAALKLRPDYLEAEVNLANVLRASGRGAQAIAAYQRVLRRRPALAEVQNNLAAALLDAGDVGGAEAAARAALALRPGFAESLATLGHALFAAGRFAEAAEIAAQACAARPGDPVLLELRAAALKDAGDADAALAAYAAVLTIAPARASARFGQAEALRAARDFAAAEQILRGLAAEYPKAWQAHHDLGNTLRDQGRFTEAEAAYRAALALAENAKTLVGLGAVLRDLQRVEESAAALRKAFGTAPNDPDVRYNLAVTQLSAGRLADGFALYDARFSRFKPRRPPGTAWGGGNARGKRILVAAEQGLGDTIQFVRYLPALARAGAKVTLLAPPPLLALLRGFAGTEAVIGPNDPAPAYDAYAMLMSLPKLLGLAAPSPIPVPYLAADPVKVAAWRARLAGLPRPWVGLAWAGNPIYPADHLRSVAPAALAPLAGAGVRFISLQKGAVDAPAWLAADWTAELADMGDTAALVAALDVVVSVDSAVAHLAGALGQKIWLLNRFDSCWRWQFGGEGNVWYPSLRQFRQDAPADWTGAVARVAAELRDV